MEFDSVEREVFKICEKLNFKKGPCSLFTTFPDIDRQTEDKKKYWHDSVKMEINCFYMMINRYSGYSRSVIFRIKSYELMTISVNIGTINLMKALFDVQIGGPYPFHPQKYSSCCLVIKQECLPALCRTTPESLKGLWGGPNLYQAKSAENQVRWWGPKIKVSQNVLKHILIWEFLKVDEILKSEKVCNWPLATKQATVKTHGHHSDHISYSALKRWRY